MRYEVFKDRYHFLVEQRINEFGNMCEHPHFDKLLDLINSFYGYKLFHPLSGDFDKNGIDFDTYCRKVWPNVIHAVEDDGDICFVHSVLSGKTSVMDRVWTTDDFFVMGGHIAEVSAEQVFKVASVHQPVGLSLVSYSGIRFDWEFVDFLHGMLRDFNELENAEKEFGKFESKMFEYNKVSHGSPLSLELKTRHDIDRVIFIRMRKQIDEMEKAIEKKFSDYIVSHKCYSHSEKGEI